MRFTPKPRPPRLYMLKHSVTGIAGASLSGWFPALADEAARGAKHKSCVLLWMDGGPSHVDTFDPKPDAGMQIHGELKAIRTAVPGVLVCEKLPRVAALMQQAAVLRGMSTEEADH